MYKRQALTSAAVLPGIMLTALEITSQLNIYFFLPILNIYFAVCLAGAASNKVALAGVGNFLKSTVIYCLTGVTTIFVGILGIQRVVASASDTVAAKAVKFTVGSVIPVVGGIVKDAFEDVYKRQARDFWRGLGESALFRARANLPGRVCRLGE